ncbi:UPF0260 protein [Alsobacter metallidurans]|uniref:UPF0260 protein GCM10007036_12670 n=1 Tax=Alsobacter metallidurans TaxID=340221 RepID=A0A917MIX2_9HYPH|nr:YcgN family cysteine cluster protein [Alsobacter metallidurans]GGH13812.1 UPF0260 protein [Alsobacter metallidurans]
MTDDATPPAAPFWRTTALDDMTAEQWESLCDGCGRCCLVKLEDEDTGQIHATDISCRLFDAGACRCRDYENRTSVVPDCVGLTPHEVRTLPWLPPTCGYRLVAEGQDLAWWHPLVSGTPDTVREAGVSVHGKVFAGEDEIAIEDVVDRIKRWPLQWPKGARTGLKARPKTR